MCSEKKKRQMAARERFILRVRGADKGTCWQNAAHRANNVDKIKYTRADLIKHARIDLLHTNLS